MSPSAFARESSAVSIHGYDKKDVQDMEDEGHFYSKSLEHRFIHCPGRCCDSDLDSFFFNHTKFGRLEEFLSYVLSYSHHQFLPSKVIAINCKRISEGIMVF
jgi:hypothetical protein